MNREILESMALEAIDADSYYDLLDNIGTMTDKELEDICNQKQS